MVPISQRKGQFGSFFCLYVISLFRNISQLEYVKKFVRFKYWHFLKLKIGFMFALNMITDPVDWISCQIVLKIRNGYKIATLFAFYISHIYYSAKHTHTQHVSLSSYKCFCKYLVCTYMFSCVQTHREENIVIYEIMK